MTGAWTQDSTYLRLRGAPCTEPDCPHLAAWHKRSELCAGHRRVALGLPPVKHLRYPELIKVAEQALTVYGARPPVALEVAAELVEKTPGALERALYRAGAHDLVHRLKGITTNPIPRTRSTDRRERITTP